MWNVFVYILFSRTIFFPENTDFLVIFTDFVLDQSGSLLYSTTSCTGVISSPLS